MLDTIRTLIVEHGRLSVPMATLGNDRDLYAAGLTSFAAIQVMLAVEQCFDVVFPDVMLNRRSFVSVDAIARSVHALLRTAA